MEKGVQVTLIAWSRVLDRNIARDTPTQTRILNPVEGREKVMLSKTKLNKAKLLRISNPTGSNIPFFFLFFSLTVVDFNYRSIHCCNADTAVP